MKRSKSSKSWLKEHFSDNYVKRAQQEGLRARSAYKLDEINQKYHIIKKGMTVVDLGAAPGSWSELAVKLVGNGGKVFALDILAMAPLAGVYFIQGDFTDEQVMRLLMAQLEANRVDVILSDMAPNTTGIPDVDHLRSIGLVEVALDFAKATLKRNGTFLAKVFQGNNFESLVKSLKSCFTTVVIVKPQSSRARSREVFLLGLGFTS